MQRLEESLPVRLAVSDFIDRHNHGGQRQARSHDADLCQLSPGGGHDSPRMILRLERMQNMRGSSDRYDTFRLRLLEIGKLLYFIE